jgi:hypothetical protein
VVPHRDWQATVLHSTKPVQLFWVLASLARLTANYFWLPAEKVNKTQHQILLVKSMYNHHPFWQHHHDSVFILLWKINQM